MVLSDFFRNLTGGVTRRVGGFLSLSQEEPSLWEELWAYFEGKYFSVDLGRYQNISVNSSALVNLRNVVLGMCFGTVIASAMMAREKNKKGAFVRKIIKSDCLWPEKAKTLAELGFEKSFAIKRDMRRVCALSKVVKCVEREAHEREVAEKREAYIEKHGNDKDFIAPKFEIDFATAHFYIPDEAHYAADIRYDNKGSGWRAFILVLIIAVILAVMVCFLLPEMLQLVDNMIGIFKSDRGY